MSATETTTEEEMVEEGDRRRIQRSRGRKRGRWVGGTLRSIGAGKDAKRLVDGRVDVATEFSYSGGR